MSDRIRFYVEGRDHVGGASYVEIGEVQIEMAPAEVLAIETAVGELEFENARLILERDQMNQELATERLNYMGAMSDLDDIVEVAWRISNHLSHYLAANYPEAKS